MVHGDKLFKCETCERDFSCKENLKRHVKSVHENMKTYKCDYCDKYSNYRHHLTRHVKTVHENIKSF